MAGSILLFRFVYLSNSLKWELKRNCTKLNFNDDDDGDKDVFPILLLFHQLASLLASINHKDRLNCETKSIRCAQQFKTHRAPAKERPLFKPNRCEEIS